MIDRYENSYDSVIQFYQALTMPYYNLLGNHAFSEVSEEYMDSILVRYEMPGYYYDFTYENWQFLVLDGTELAAYSRYLHPELADEGDSLWQLVQGQVNALTWNGGISRNQQSWMRLKLQESQEAEKNVILFCHFPVYPDSMRLGLWNDSVIVDLLEEYPNVVAYINGHEHTGEYGYKNGIHYYTQKAMVDFPDKNSFSILEIYKHELRLKGFGNIADTVFLYSNIKKKPLIFDLSDSILHYSDHTHSFVGKFIPDTSQHYSQIVYNLDTSQYDNRYFSVLNDSLMLNTEADISFISNLQLEIIAAGCEFDTTWQVFNLVFDTSSAIFNYALADTLLSVYNEYNIRLDSFVTDYSRWGLEYIMVAADSSVVSTMVTDTSLTIIPKKVGTSLVKVTAMDTYLDKMYYHSFSVEIYDPDNHPPVPVELPDTELYVLLYDTLSIDLDEIFTDPDGDKLSFDFFLSDTISFYGTLFDSILLIYANISSQTSCEIIANDNRGGTAVIELDISVNQNPVRINGEEEYVFPYVEMQCVEIDLDTVFTDPDSDTLFYLLTEASIPALIVNDAFLEICPETAGKGTLWLEIIDHKNGMLNDSLTIRFEAQSVSLESFYQVRSPIIEYLFPNPSEGIIFIKLNKAYSGTVSFVLTDLSGRVLQKSSAEIGKHEKTLYDFRFNKNLMNGVYLLEIIIQEVNYRSSEIIILQR